MKPKFWLERWQNNQIGFHQTQFNALLLEHWPALELPKGADVFVPLCGKSLDMRWLEQNEHRVIGVELAQVAIQTYFAEGQEVAQQTQLEGVAAFSGAQTTIFHSDLFSLTAPMLETVSGLFDRGALVAMPSDMRARYVDHLLRIVPDGCRILLLTFEYDQNLVAGPPHSVTPEEVQALYGGRCQVEKLDSVVTEQVPPHFQSQGVRQAVESVYRMTKQT